MTNLKIKLCSFDWFNPTNKVKAIKVAEAIDSELDNLQRKALDPYAYKYHRKRLAGLEARLTFLLHSDTDEWLKAKVKDSVKSIKACKLLNPAPRFDDIYYNNHPDKL